MKVIILIGHPAHVHMFKHFAHEMCKRNHNVLFVTLDKEFEIELLRKENLNYVVLGKKHKGLLRKVFDTLFFVIKTLYIAKQYDPSLFLSHGSLVAAIVSKILHRPHIALEDTYNMEQVSIYAPFTDVILTSNYQHPLSNHKRNLSIPIYNELLYLHPNKYYLQKESILDKGYILVRFVAWQASHDIGHKGITYDEKVKLIAELSKYTKVWISSESKLPNELENKRLKISPDMIHDIEANAALIFSEGSTMVEEAAMLGVPSIYINNNGTLYTDHLEESYGLCYTYAEDDIVKATNKAISLLQKDNEELRNEWNAKKRKMLHEHIDATKFLVWFIENYPNSLQQTRKNQHDNEFWESFK